MEDLKMKKVTLVLMVFCLGLVALAGLAQAFNKGFEAEPGVVSDLGVTGSDSVTAPFEIIADDARSNGFYIETNESVGNSNSNPPAEDDGWVTWSLTAPAGVYKILGMIHEDDSDSFWVRIIDSTGTPVETWPAKYPAARPDGFARWNGADGSSWEWDDVHDDDGEDVSGVIDLDRLPVRFTLPADGDYKIQFARREDGLELDGIFITDDLTLDRGELPDDYIPPTWDVPNALVLYEWWQYAVPDNELPDTPDLESLPGFPAEPGDAGGACELRNTLWDSNENYVIRLKSILKVEEAGLLGLGTRSDDGSMLFVGNWWEEAAELELVVDNNGSHGSRYRSGVVDVEAGYVGIVVTMQNGGGGDILRVFSWTTGDEDGRHQMRDQTELVSLYDASIPSPEHEATEVPLDVELSWEPPFQNAPSEYTFNIGLWGQGWTSSTTVSGTSNSPAGLEGAKTYRWRVDTTEPNDVPGGVPVLREGTEWLFTTIGAISITSQPANVAAEAGADVLLAVEAESLVVPLSYQWKLDGVDIDGATDSTLSITELDAADEGVYSCVVSNSADSVESSGAAVNLKELIAHWPLNGDGLDASGNGYHLVAQGDTAFTEGMVDQAASLDGSGDDLIQADPNFPVGDAINGQAAITIACWIKSNIIDTNTGFIIFQPPAGNDDFDLRYDSSGANGGGVNVLKMGVTTTVGVRQLETSNNSQTTEWQHVIMTWQSGAIIRCYLNGLEDTPTDVDGAVNGVLTGFGEVILGRGGKDDAASEGWDGLIDEVYVFDYAMDFAEAAHFYISQGGGPLDPICVPGSGGPADLNDDCVVDITDLEIFMNQYLKSNFAE